MATSRNSRYPYHLAKQIEARLREQDVVLPNDGVLLRLLETLYFASLKTDEGRPCLCTVNFVDPDQAESSERSQAPAHQWRTTRFGQRLPLNVPTLIKLAEAADPEVSSLCAYCDAKGELFIWGMVDQELRYGDYVALSSTADPQRPGQFQATINGVGNICVYRNYSLLGSLEQNALVEQYHDVLWSGPVHERLKANMKATLADDRTARTRKAEIDLNRLENEMLVRWQNAVCRVLWNIQQYRHGGGLLIVPGFPANDTNVKYQLTYDRLPQALVGLVQHQLLRQQLTERIANQCQDRERDTVPCSFHFDAAANQERLDQHKQEALGCVRFIASLSRVDGFVLMDKHLVVHGFGVELRSAAELTEIYVAGDTKASPQLLRSAQVTEFGTRHRAMMRYCHDNPEAVGFVVSQDGDIRAILNVDGRLVLWENINAQLAFKTEGRATKINNVAPMLRLFQFWEHSLARLTSP